MSVWPQNVLSAPHVRSSTLGRMSESTGEQVKDLDSWALLSEAWAGAWESLFFVGSLMGSNPAD